MPKETMMKKFFQKQKVILAVLAFAIIVIALVYFAILPLLGKIDSTNYQIQQDGVDYEMTIKYFDELPKIQKQYEELQRSGDLGDVLLDKDRAVLLIEKLEKLAQQTNNTIAIEAQSTNDSKKVAVSTKASAATEIDLMSELPNPDFLQLRVTLVGRYGSILNFIKSLEKFEYYGDITGIKIGKNEDKAAASSSLVVDSGIASPFTTNVGVGDTKVVKAENDMLKASLDTVFYVKKN